MIDCTMLRIVARYPYTWVRTKSMTSNLVISAVKRLRITISGVELEVEENREYQGKRYWRMVEAEIPRYFARSA